VIQGVVLFTSSVYILLNLMADMAYFLVNPRLRGKAMAAVISPVVEAREASPAQRAWRRLLRRRGAMLGLFFVLFFVLMAIFAPLIAPYDPIATSWSAVRKAPSWEYLFGTDEIGRDVLSRIIWGAQASLMAGLVSVSISMALGIPIGLLAAYLGGWTDSLISRFTDAMLAVPFLILAIALSAFLGPSLGNAMIAIGVSAMPVFIRLTRAQVMAVKVEDYIEAARAVGNPHWRIALRHILPNVLPPLIVQATLSIAAAIIAEASLSFLGLGQQPPAPSWGSMLNTAKNYMDNAPWMAVWPGLSIFLLVLSFNLLGDGLRDALDPRQK
jgi:peptide/nickel transport system permease protein